jgi:hypothetical protein
MLGKAVFNTSDKPQFSDAFIAKIIWKPAGVKCSLQFINSTTCFQSSKSTRF